jgi:hypothetical protein
MLAKDGSTVPENISARLSRQTCIFISADMAALSEFSLSNDAIARCICRPETHAILRLHPIPEKSRYRGIRSSIPVRLPPTEIFGKNSQLEGLERCNNRTGYAAHAS